MFLGLCMKRNNINYYTKPFFLNDNNEDSFIGQIIRDVDFSLYIKLNDIFEISIIIYPEKDSYYIANKNNLEPDIFKILGKYPIVLDKIDDMIVFDNVKKGVIRKKLDEVYDINIEFSVILMKNGLDYILSHPYIYGKNNFLNNN